MGYISLGNYFMSNCNLMNIGTQFAYSCVVCVLMFRGIKQLTVHCTLYTVHCALCTVHCTLYTVHCTLYTVHCTLYTALYDVLYVISIN